MPRAPQVDYSPLDRLNQSLQKSADAIQRKNDVDFQITQQILSRAIQKEQEGIRAGAVQKFSQAISPRRAARLMGAEIQPGQPEFEYPSEDERRSALDQAVSTMMLTGPEGMQGAKVLTDIYDRTAQRTPAMQSDWTDVLDAEGFPTIVTRSGVPMRKQQKVDTRTQQALPNMFRWQPMSDPNASNSNIVGRMMMGQAQDLLKERADRQAKIEKIFGNASQFQPPSKLKDESDEAFSARRNRIFEVRTQKQKEAEPEARRILEAEELLRGMGWNIEPYRPPWSSGSVTPPNPAGQGGAGAPTGGAGGTGKKSISLSAAKAKWGAAVGDYTDDELREYLKTLGYEEITD